MKSKLAIAATAFSIMAILVPVSPARAADPVPVSIGTPAQVGEAMDFTVKVNIAGVADFDTAQYDVTYDPAVLRVDNVAGGSIGGTAIPVDAWGLVPSEVQGRIRVINNVPNYPGVSGSGYLAEIRFHVLGAAGTSSPIRLSNGVLGDKNAQAIPATWTDGSVQVTTPLATDFSASRLEATVGDTITFTSTTSGGTPGYTYAWDFNGDNVTDSTLSSPTHSYASPGVYTVTLTATDALGTTATKTRSGYVTIYATLVADFSADRTEATVGQTITFSNATSGGKPGYTYAWDFNGDNVTDSTAASPTHSYTAPGVYTVSVTVTDSLTNTSTKTRSGYVTIYATLVADFSADRTEATVGQTITFSDATSGGKPGYAYAWDFNNDGTSDSALPNPTHSYAAPGVYTVSLAVTDNLTNASTKTRSGYITIYASLVADFSADKTKAVVGETLAFTGAPSGGKPGYTYAWDFNSDNATDSTAASPTYSYGAPGVYTVTVTVTDSLGNVNNKVRSGYITVYARGDANGDGTVNSLDITHIEHIIMGDTGYPYTTWADAKLDGSINALDITAVERIILP